MSQEIPPKTPPTDVDLERYIDRPFDLVARVQAAKDAAQREMETFGHVSEYEIRKIYGQKIELSYGHPDDPHPADVLKPTVPMRSTSTEIKKGTAPDQSQAEFDFGAPPADLLESPAKDS